MFIKYCLATATLENTEWLGTKQIVNLLHPEKAAISSNAELKNPVRIKTNTTYRQSFLSQFHFPLKVSTLQLMHMIAD